MSSTDARPVKRKGSTIVAVLNWSARIGAILSLLLVIPAIGDPPGGSDKRIFEIVLFVLVITAPQFLVDWLAIAAERVAEGTLEKGEDQRGFWNLGAWVGAIERPLLLGALVGGFAEFIAGWFVLKGIAGYQLEMNREALAKRRAFQLFLLNNGVSFAGVALCWWLWRLLNLPVVGP